VSRTSTVRQWVRHFGFRSAAASVGGYLAVRALGSGIRRCVAPPLGDYARSGGSVTTSVGAFLGAMGWDSADIEPVLEEYRDVAARLADRCETVDLVYPHTHGVETETGAFLYGVVRLLRARSVVETGVADGRSSWLILAALERNGDGVLHSFDIRDEVGRLVGAHPQWRLEIISSRQPEEALRRALRRIGEVDLFFHDSDHRYLPQLFEYEAAWPILTPGGVLASDDVDNTPAFLDFCRARRLRPAFLFDARKVTGAVRTHGARQRPATQAQSVTA
jgi:predicted O-methyltransferase YrrM